MVLIINNTAAGNSKIEKSEMTSILNILIKTKM